MAIEYDLTPKPEEVLKAFGVSLMNISIFLQSGVEMKVTPYALKFESKDGTPLGSVMLKASAVKYALEGKLTPASTTSVGANITAEILKIMNVLDSKSESATVIGVDMAAGPDESAATIPETENTPSKPAFVTPDGPEFLKEVQDAVDGLPDVKEHKHGATESGKIDPSVSGTTTGTFKSSTPIGMMEIPKYVTEAKKMSKVELLYATNIYQRVQGTSSGSTYICVAISQDMRVAVRFKGTNNTTVSIRAEGNTEKYKKNLETAGLDIKDDKYASVHLNCDSQLLATRAVGAVLMGMGIEFTTPMPNMKYAGIAA